MKILVISVFLSLLSFTNSGVAAKLEVVDRLPEKAPAPKEVSEQDLIQAAKWLESADKENDKKIESNEASIASAKTAQEAKKESEIPILTNNKSKTVDVNSSSTSRILISLGLVLGLLFGFSVFLKKFLKKSPHKKNSQIKILTQHYLGPKKSLAIIRVAGESMLIGITDQNINLIKPLALLDEEIPDNVSKSFSNSLDNSMDGLSEAEEEFSISKIKDFVSGRLKNMKEI